MHNIFKGGKTWIGSYEAQTKQLSIVWMFPYEPNPTKVFRSQSTYKKMIACFSGLTGHVETIPSEDRKIISAKYRNLFAKSPHQNQKKHQKLAQHSSSRQRQHTHTACKTIDYLKDKNVELMSHCPYSPDLSPNDFFFSHYAKQKMFRQRFSSPRKSVDALQNHVSEISFSE